MNKAIVASAAPAAVGPYVHAVEATLDSTADSGKDSAFASGNMLFCSGQLGLDPETGELLDGVEAQARQSLVNLGAVLKEAGYDYSDVVKTMIFIDSMDDFGKVNEIYGEFFDEWKPARSCVEAAKIPKGGLVEIECIAVK